MDEQRILLIEPPFFRFKGANSEIFPMGLGYVASLLHSRGYTVRVYNGEQFGEKEKTDVISYKELVESHEKFIKGLHTEEHFIWKEVEHYLRKYNPTLVGMGTTTTKMRSALTIAKIVKQVNPTIKIVIGGLHATTMPEDILKSKDVDFVVRGEGEFTFLELIQALEKNASYTEIKGLSYKNQSQQFVHNSERPYLENLDELPFPNKSLIIDEQKEKATYRIIFCSRGCPYRCNYCNTASIWGRKVRYHSVQRIVAEMKKIKQEEKTNSIQFFDDTFTLYPKWVAALCNEMIKEEVNMTWSCLTRIDKLDTATLTLMKKAGCTGIAMGVESGSQRVLDAVKKDLTLEKIMQGQKIINEVGIPWDAFIMLGMPYETKEDMRATITLMKKLQCRSLILSVFTPYPGTELYEVTKQMGLITATGDWEHYSHQSSENHFNTNVSPEEYQALLAEAIKIADRKNMSMKDLWKKAYKKRTYFLKNPLELGRKMVRVVKSVI